MITIVEPKQHIEKLWGKQKVRQTAIYRMMRYVLRVNYSGKIALHNVVTGQLVILNQEEAEAIEKLPMAYTPVNEALVTNYYLVPEEYNEHQQVVNLRKVLRDLVEIQRPHAITQYTILPTTTCNARCYYCFERGVKAVTMTKQTADDVVNYIEKHCGETRSVFLRWFGGEPTLASDRINQICFGLKNRGIVFSSAITTNGFLFDKNLVEQAKSLWNLKSAHITIDGTEKNYIRIKNYINAQENPYEKVMRNVHLLLNNGINVQVRMNFDTNNYLDFANLVDDLKTRFDNHPLLHVFAHPINGVLRQGDDIWFEHKVMEMQNIARNSGLYRKAYQLPSLEFMGCAAMNDDTTTITAEGKLVRCSEQFGDDQVVGDLNSETIDKSVVQSWKQIADYDKCAFCYLFPHCLRLLNCAIKDDCLYKEEYSYEFNDAVLSSIKRWACEK